MRMLALIGAIVLTLAPAMAATPVDTERLQVSVDDVHGGVVRLTSDPEYFGDLKLTVEITDGATGEVFPTGQEDLGDGLQLVQRLEPVRDPETGELTRLTLGLAFMNPRGAPQRWLMVRVIATPATNAVASFWNGEFDYTRCTADVLTRDMRYAIPLVALYGPGGGLAWGIEADQLVSYFEGGASFDGERQFWFGYKVVVDGEPTFGYLDAFERHHDLFPEIFSIHGRQCDFRCTGPGADYKAWGTGSPELTRRFRGTWDWCMRGFIHAGNWANRRELWRDSEKSYQSFAKSVTRREENLRTCRTAGMRYFAPTWTDVDLAAERWPDSRVFNPNVNTVWEKCLTTDCHMTFPASNAYFDSMKKDLEEIMGDGSLSSVGRAWDDEGVYVRVPMGTAQLMDYIHTLDAPVGKAGVTPNNGDYAVLARADAVLIEHSPTRLVENWNKRLMAGEKVMSWWDDFDLWSYTDYENGERDRLRADLAAMARFIRLRSYQLGGVPMYRQASGIRSQVEALPRIARVVSAGWQPVPAMKGDGDLWFARYGSAPPKGQFIYLPGGGDTTWLVAGNPAAEAAASDIEVHSKYLGYTGVLLADDTGAPLRQTATGGITTLHATVPAAWERVFYPCLRLSEGTDITATVKVEDNLRERIFRVTVHEVRTPGEVSAVARPDWFGGGRVRWQGQQLPNKSETVWYVPWPHPIDRPGVLEFDFGSAWFHATRDALLDFDFVSDGEPACTIVVPEDANADEDYAAFRLQEYFRFWTREVEGAEVALPIAHGEVEGRRVLIGRATGAGSLKVAYPGHISVVDEALLVWSDTADPVPAMLKLLDVLDTKYGYYGVCPESFESDREQSVYERAELVGEAFDDTQYLPIPGE